MDTKQAHGTSLDRQRLLLVSPEVLPTVWSGIVPLFEKAKAYWEGFSTLEQIYQAIAQQSMQLWVGMSPREMQIAALMQYLTYPSIKTCRIVLIGGSNLKDYMFALSVLETWAQKNGAQMCEIIGREALERILTPHGYNRRAVLLQKPLGQETVH